jgi:transcriptional regulator with XRE-family HTH domain
MSIGTAIAQARVAQRPKMSQEALAREVGLHQTTISAFERGTQRPSIEQVRSIAHALGQEPERLLEEAGYALAVMIRDGRTYRVWVSRDDDLVESVVEGEEPVPALEPAEEFAAAAGELAIDMTEEDRELALGFLRQLRERGRARRGQ